MSRSIFAALLIAFASSATLAADPQKPAESSLSGKVMQDLPGNNSGGMTSNPNAQPDTTSLSGKIMHEHPGAVNAGTTDMPTAKPAEQSLSGKAMRDLPGNK